MAIISYPFESQNTGTVEAPIYDRAITAEQERRFNKLRYTNGVFTPPADSLQVTAPNGNMTVQVGAGGCHIEGSLMYNTTASSFTLVAHSSLPKIYRVVARFDTSVSVRAVNLYAKEGTPATTPEAPALIQEANYFEIALADVRVPGGATSITNSNITDQRLNSTLCGQVVPAIPTPIDLTALYNQYQASLNEYLDIVAAAIDETLAGNLQAQITANAANIATNATDITQLETDTAISAETLAAFTAIGFDPADYPGGGIADKLDRFIKSRLGVQMELVWENASPTSSFAAQMISLDLADIKFAFITAYSGNGTYVNALIEKGKKRIITEQFWSDGKTISYERRFTATDTGITVEGGINSGVAANIVIVPNAIYKVKGVQ